MLYSQNKKQDKNKSDGYFLSLLKGCNTFTYELPF